MPIISMFYGVIIRMYLLDNKHHNLPHIHAKYAEFEASINIADGEILAGKLPKKTASFSSSMDRTSSGWIKGWLGSICRRWKPL